MAPRKSLRVQLTPYPRQILVSLTLGFKAFGLKDVKSGFLDPSGVVRHLVVMHASLRDDGWCRDVVLRGPCQVLQRQNM
jgi:hypothetical protein